MLAVSSKPQLTKRRIGSDRREAIDIERGQVEGASLKTAKRRGIESAGEKKTGDLGELVETSLSDRDSLRRVERTIGGNAPIESLRGQQRAGRLRESSATEWAEFVAPLEQVGEQIGGIAPEFQQVGIGRARRSPAAGAGTRATDRPFGVSVEEAARGGLRQSEASAKRVKVRPNQSAPPSRAPPKSWTERRATPIGGACDSSSGSRGAARSAQAREDWAKWSA